MVMILLFTILLGWSTSSVAQGTRASPGLLSVTDGVKGDINVTLSGTVWTIIDDVVTNNKLAPMPALTLKGNPTGATANPLDITALAAKQMLSVDQVTNTSDAVKWVTPKKLENTRLKKRTFAQGNAATITIDANSYDVIKIAELLQPTTFAPPSPAAPDLDDALRIEICTTVQRALTFSPAAGGFVAGHSLALPTLSEPGGCVKHLFEWTGTLWSFVSSTQTTTRGIAGQVYTSNGPTTEPGWAAATGGGGTIGDVLLPVGSVNLPTTNMAVIDNSQTITRLRFDDTTAECAWWGPFRMKPDYVSTPVFKWQYSMVSATSGGVSINVSVLAIAPGSSDDPNNEANYGAVNNCDDTTVPTTVGRMKELSCPLTNTDGLVAGAMTKIRVCRVPSDTADTATGDMSGLAAAMTYTK
jgi:hypothetical protein